MPKVLAADSRRDQGRGRGWHTVAGNLGEVKWL